MLIRFYFNLHTPVPWPSDSRENTALLSLWQPENLVTLVRRIL
jgi:hypothetical protein